MTSGRANEAYVVGLADDCLVLSHRLAEWSSLAPDLEEDIALTNIGLDLLGQARMLYGYANELGDGNRTEDDYAYLRTAREFTNALLVEQPNGDFAKTIGRQLFFSTFQHLLWEQIKPSQDETLSAIAAKASKETTYHLRHARTWLMRLGDGTEESHRRMQAGIDELWRFTDELISDELAPAGGIESTASKGADWLAEQWRLCIASDLAAATLHIPSDPYQTHGGRQGLHTNHLGLLLAEMQVLQRTYPGASW